MWFGGRYRTHRCCSHFFVGFLWCRLPDDIFRLIFLIKSGILCVLRHRAHPVSQTMRENRFDVPNSSGAIWSTVGWWPLRGASRNWFVQWNQPVEVPLWFETLVQSTICKQNVNIGYNNQTRNGTLTSAPKLTKQMTVRNGLPSRIHFHKIFKPIYFCNWPSVQVRKAHLQLAFAYTAAFQQMARNINKNAVGTTGKNNNENINSKNWTKTKTNEKKLNGKKWQRNEMIFSVLAARTSWNAPEHDIRPSFRRPPPTDNKWMDAINCACRTIK